MNNSSEREHGTTDCGEQSHHAPGHLPSHAACYMHFMCLEAESIPAVACGHVRTKQRGASRSGQLAAPWTYRLRGHK